MKKRILTLWDIDGTLLNIYKYHTPAYQKGIRTSLFYICKKLEFVEYAYRIRSTGYLRPLTLY